MRYVIILYPYFSLNERETGMKNIMPMTDFQPLIQKLDSSWDEKEAALLIRRMIGAAWHTGSLDKAIIPPAEAFREILETRLARTEEPKAEMALFGLLYELEQGMADREKALETARHIFHLAETAEIPVDYVMASFRLAKAFLYLEKFVESADWSLKAMKLGRELEQKGAPDEAFKRMLADQESRLTVRLYVIGGMDEEIDRAAASCIRRWEDLGDPVGLADALGMISEARLFQGRWEDSLEAARRALEEVGYPGKTQGTGYALWCGATSLGRQGDFEEALKWANEAEQVNLDLNNAEAAIEARLTRAAIYCMAGNYPEALEECEAIVLDVTSLNYDSLRDWALTDRAWYRMRLGLLTPVPEVEALCPDRKSPFRANILYLLSHVLQHSGKDGSSARIEAISLYRQFGLSWHLERALRGEPYL
ncbi:tetratricopeptide repeat protein [Planctomycetota bacterium]